MTNEKQLYPNIETEFLITIEKPFSKHYVDKIFKKNIENFKLTYDVIEVENRKKNSIKEWTPESTFINLYISDSLIENHFSKNSKDIDILFDSFKNLIEPIMKTLNSSNDIISLNKTSPIFIFSTHYRAKDNYIFQYLFGLDGSDNDFISSLIDVFKSIEKYNENESNDFQKAVAKSYSQSNKKIYLFYLEKKWNFMNPLFEVGKEINAKYREGKDFRIKKPHILMHRENYKKYFVFDNNWVLSFDGSETQMIKPNDVSIYSNISETKLKNAKDFFKNTIHPSLNQFDGILPSYEVQREYYDYFELIISSIIFAYTSLEAFANICIPETFDYSIKKDEKKTKLTKNEIEKKFTLREKFKIILRSILKTSDPTKELWWNSFIELENLRDEIIHTKQSKSEDRYSKLLSKKVFKTIAIHKKIINYYGYYIIENRIELLNEFPYNFGFDELFPSLTDEKSYKSSYNIIHRIIDENDEDSL